MTEHQKFLVVLWTVLMGFACIVGIVATIKGAVGG